VNLKKIFREIFQATNFVHFTTL